MAESKTGTISANAKKRTARRSRASAASRSPGGTSGCARRSAAPPQRPRLAVNRSSRHIVVQLIDDLAGHTLASASTLEADVRGARRRQEGPRGRKVGELVAERAREAGVTAVVFDRGGYDYHGRIAALADAAREGGLEF